MPSTLDDLLVIDDHSGEVRLIQEVVETADMDLTLHTVSDEEDIRDLVHQRGEFDEFQPDAVLLDWNLSKRTGAEVLRELSETLSHSIVAIMTSSKHQKEKVQSEGPQIDKYLTKPENPKGYIDIIRSLSN